MFFRRRSGLPTLGQHLSYRWLCLLALCVIGCREDKTPDYTPSVAAAESALRRSLDAWKAGLPAGEIAGTKPLIFVTDATRKPGQILGDYRILGETRGPSGRTFVVILDLRNPDEELRTQYIVVGIDPLWVFRQEDYELLTHWDHVMRPDEDENAEAEPATESTEQ